MHLDNDVSLDFMDDEDVHQRHYAFLVSEEGFVEQQPGEINTNDGGRGLYWQDPSGHKLEIITRPYGG